MDPRLLAQLAYWLVLNLRDKEIQEEDQFGGEKNETAWWSVKTLSSEVKFDLGLYSQFCYLSQTHLTSLSLGFLTC